MYNPIQEGNMTRNISRVSLVAVLALLVAGCARQTAPATPATPAAPIQLTLMNSNKLLADACNATVVTTIQLRDAGKMAQSDVRIVQDYVKVLVRLSNGITAILMNGQPWAAQQAALIALAANTAPPLVTVQDPTAVALVAQLTSLLTQVKGQVMQ